ncbi:DUF983 domain-containing protein [Emcibacter nanhaiensis]|uniref:DUF983 domain-containing protein n=1 Tax=Emcibacter nanhaiensis TaxID=1505037 RepID=A0A501PLZ2_9PROT|nr:DUF983 domain-containing protein [Emcibacter nanhaiensis]TPD61519.1 DUF983 domain-containing protein [Emcibacter nanhaiensis]
MNDIVDSQTAKSYGGSKPSVMEAIKKGLRRKCPCCGEGRAFSGYLKVTGECDVCKTELGDIRADDFPPYLTIFIVGHIVVPALVYMEAILHPPTWLQITLWPTVALALSLALLPVLKGGVVGMMWALGLKGDEQH